MLLPLYQAWMLFLYCTFVTPGAEGQVECIASWDTSSQAVYNLHTVH